MALKCLLWLSLLSALKGAAETACTETLDHHVLLQTTVKGSAERGGKNGLASLAEQSLHSLADTAEDVQAARSSANAAMGFESQAADLLRVAYREVQQAEDIQEARVYQEANVTQILHEAVQEAQSASLGQDTTLLHALRQAEVAQAAMIQDASQEDQALAGLRNAMASAAQAATSAKLVDETQTTRVLDDAMAEIKEFKNLPRQLVFAENEQTEEQMATYRAHAYMVETQKARQANQKEVQHELAAAAADRRKAEVARQEASAMYQAASATQDALEKQAARTAQTLLKVSTEASHAAQYIQASLLKPGASSGH